jgi:hypothetical protein
MLPLILILAVELLKFPDEKQYAQKSGNKLNLAKQLEINVLNRNIVKIVVTQTSNKQRRYTYTHNIDEFTVPYMDFVIVWRTCTFSLICSCTVGTVGIWVIINITISIISSITITSIITTSIMTTTSIITTTTSIIITISIITFITMQVVLV